MEYSKIGLMAIILHVIINADTLFRKGAVEKLDTRSKYRHFLITVLLFYASDTCWGVFLAYRQIVLSYIFAVLFFLTMGASVFLWARYIRAFLNQKNFWSNLLRYIAWVLFITDIVALIANLFTNMMFHFEPDGTYVTTRARQLIFDIQLVLFAIVGIYTVIRSWRLKDLDRSHHIAVGISGLLMSFFSLLQAKYPMTPFYSMGLLISTSVMHSFVLIDDRIESIRKIGSFKRVAYKDPLTNLRNSTAYAETKTAINKKLKDGSLLDFGIAVLDLNNLKLINDTQGHEAGDKYIQDASCLICRVFAHSPVFRIGGDEFVVLLMNNDFTNRDSLAQDFNRQVEDNLTGAGPVVALGMSVFRPGNDYGFDEVFERADENMYKRKKELKQQKAEQEA